MGYYVQGPMIGKAGYIVESLGGRFISPSEAREIANDADRDEGVVVVVDNGMFEAAGYAFSPEEFDAFMNPNDDRPKQFVALSKDRIHQETGYKVSNSP